MKKKLISFLLLFIISVTSVFSVSAVSGDSINKIFDKFLEISVEERESYFALLAPMLMVDSGIDSLINDVEIYEPGKSETLMSKYIGKLLTYTEKEVLINLLKSVKCTDITGRRDLLDTIKYKKATDISSETEEAINMFLGKTYDETPSLKLLLEQGNYTADIIANALGSLVTINGGEALYIFDGEFFEVNSVNEALENGIEEIWVDYVLTENGFEKKAEADGENILLTSFAEKSVQKLNDSFTTAQKNKIAEGLLQTGFVIVEKKNEKPGPSGGNGGNNAGNVIPDVNTYEDVYNIEVSEGETKLVSFETDFVRPVLYKKDGEKLTVIKYSALSEGKIISKITESGTYVIREASVKFADCDNWAKDYIEMLASRGIINGKADNLYMPGDTITREEFVKLITELLDLAPSENATHFTDVKNDAWYAGYVAVAFENKIISGISETEFGVGAPIKRQDMAKIINTVLELKGIKAESSNANAFVDYENISDYAKSHVLSIYNLGIISGDENKNFNPNNFATRAEAAKMVYGMLVQIILN